MRVDAKKLKSFLFDAGILGRKEMETIEKKMQKNGASFEKELIDSGIIDEAELRRLEAYILGIPFVNLKKEDIPKDVLFLIPEQIAKARKSIAFEAEGKVLKVAMADPDDLQTIDFIRKKTGMEIAPCLSMEDSIEYGLKQYQKSLQAEFVDIIKEGEKVSGSDNLQKMAEDLPIVKILDTLIKHAVLERASDVHIEPEESNAIIRYRVDGILHDAMDLPKRSLSGLIARIKVLSGLKLDEHRLPQDGRFKFNLLNSNVAIRVSIIPVFDGEKAVLRLLDESNKGLTLEGLGARGDILEIIRRNIKKPNGMLLSTGPTGSGKTTTLYAIVDILNSSSINISTIEDPVEYRISRVNQTQVNPKAGLMFANGLRSLLRQDPDVLMVGEIRDTETAEIAIHSALTGHLVLSTLHTNSAAGSLPRLIDMKIEPFLAASCVNAIIGQRLVRKLCPECRTIFKMSESAADLLEKKINSKKVENILQKEGMLGNKKSWKSLDFFKSAGCDKCRGGFLGRCGIFEVMEISEAIKDLILSKPDESQLERQAINEGMTTMLEDGIVKAAQGITTLEEVLKAVK